MTIRNLDALFQPRSVALIGASPRPGSLGQLVARNLVRAGFRGPTYFVNPTATTIEDQPCYPDVASLPEAPDLAIIATPPDAVANLIVQLGQRGTRAAVVITAGFGEGGSAEGAVRRQAMLDAARPHLLRIVGPNCVGLAVPGIGLDASFMHLPARKGGLAFVAQSGAVIVGVVDWAEPRGIGFSHLVSIGDMADVDFGDVLDYLAADPDTTAILLYVEAITNARKFMSAARAAARVKPVIVMKAGRHAEGARAAASHTGAMAGSDAVYGAAFRRAGMLRVTSLLELFEAAEVLADGPDSADGSRFPLNDGGARLAIVSNGGGFGVLATDALVDEGGQLAELSEQTITQLGRVLPPTWSQANPVDLIGDATGQRYADALHHVLADPGVDAVLVMNCPTAVASSVEAADAVAHFLGETKSTVPVVGAWIGDSDQVIEARQILHRQGIATFSTPGEAVRAFMQRVRYSRAQAQLLETPAADASDFSRYREGASALIAEALEEEREWLDATEVNQLLAGYGIPVVDTRIADTADGTLLAAETIGYPVALKIVSPDIVHKTDVGGIALDLGSPEALRDALTRMVERVQSVAPDATIDGFVVQAMIDRPRAHELILGMAEDPQFGPVLLFGHGGTATEVIADRSLALPPLNLALANALIDRTRISRLLAGYRDRPPADREAIARTLVRLSELIVDHAEIVELDINPLLADEEGAIALDARIRIAPLDREDRIPLAISPYPQSLGRTVDLEDGRQLELRPIRPEDESLVRSAIATLEPETARPRFLAPITELTHESAARLTQIDYDRELVLALIEDGQILALGRLGADPDNERADIELSALAGDGRPQLLDAMLDALLTEAYSRNIARLAVYLDPATIADDRYRLRGFAPPAVREGIEQWVADLSDDS
jgi:acetyltransferase